MLQNDNGNHNVHNHFYKWQNFGKQNKQMLFMIIGIVVFTKSFHFVVKCLEHFQNYKYVISGAFKKCSDLKTY